MDTKLVGIVISGSKYIRINKNSELDLQSSPIKLEGAPSNLCVRMTVGSMGDCHQLCRKYKTSLNFIKCPGLKGEASSEIKHACPTTVIMRKWLKDSCSNLTQCLLLHYICETFISLQRLSNNQSFKH